MENLTSFQNPLQADRINLTNPKQLWQIVGFVALIMILFGFGTALKNWVLSKMPSSVQGAASGNNGANSMTWAQ